MNSFEFDVCAPDPDVKTVYLPSADGVSQVRVKRWEPSGCEGGMPRGVIQIVHGMSEHIDRYNAVAANMVQLGYVVVAHDHIGHGKTASCEADLGHIPLAAGKEALIADIFAVRQWMGDYCGSSTPYIIFGHSMGSFLVRTYLARHADTVDAAIICGTGQQPGMLSAAGNALARVLCVLKGERHRSSFLHGMGAGAYSKDIENPRTEFDWLSLRPSVVDAYINDPLCGAMFTVGGYAALTSLTAEMVKPECAAAVPKDMPLLFIAGEEDPVGSFGKGVRAAAQQYRDAGCTEVSEILYPGMRHEILNEDIRDQVCLDMHAWMVSFHPYLMPC